MGHRGGVSVVVACLLGATIAAPGRSAAAVEHVHARVTAPVHSVSVGGTGVASYPAFDPSVSRYGVTTTTATAGTVTVTASTSDPTGTVRVDGRTVAGTSTTLTDLSDGDEISVLIDDAAGTTAYSYVYLPAGFPTLERTTPPGQEPTRSHVLLDLSNTWWKSFPGSAADDLPDFFDAAVDANGVPAYVHVSPQVERVMDFQLQPNGHYTMARPTPTAGRTGEAIYEYDRQMHQVGGPYETVGLTNTDGHDAILLPDGSRWLMAYEPNATTGRVDSIIQHVGAAGDLLFEWTSAPYADETMTTPDDPDYAHINSFELMPDGDLLVSFRNLSAVYRIDTSTSGGSVVWKLGGRDSDFAITDAEGHPDGGPCAQHTARLTSDGDIAIYDDGSNGFFGTLCVDPSDPNGPAVTRGQTRAIVLHLDEDAHTARIVRSYAPSGWFSLFAGSTIPLPDNHVMVGWAPEQRAIATELDDDDQVVWELRDANPEVAQRYYSYRSQPADFADAVRPVVAVNRPAAGAVYREGQTVRAALGCTDAGGSSLRSCDGTVGDGDPLDTTPGRHRYVATATDGAGNRTTVTRTYAVRPASRPDALVRRAGGRFVGDGRYGGPDGQRVTASLARKGSTQRLQVRLENDGIRSDRVRYAVRVSGPGHRRAFVVTASALGGVARLAPGGHRTLRIKVRRTAAARRGDAVVVRVRLVSTGSGRSDGVSASLTAR